MILVSAKPTRSGNPTRVYYPSQENFSRVNSLPYLFRKMRIYKNITVGSLAKKIGVSEEQVTEIESGRRPPSLTFCLSCAKEFGFNPEWIKRKWVHEMVIQFQTKLENRFLKD